MVFALDFDGSASLDFLLHPRNRQEEDVLHLKRWIRQSCINRTLFSSALAVSGALGALAAAPALGDSGTYHCPGSNSSYAYTCVETDPNGTGDGSEGGSSAMAEGASRDLSSCLWVKGNRVGCSGYNVTASGNYQRYFPGTDLAAGQWCARTWLDSNGTDTQIDSVCINGPT